MARYGFHQPIALEDLFREPVRTVRAWPRLAQKIGVWFGALVLNVSLLIMLTLSLVAVNDWRAPKIVTERVTNALSEVLPSQTVFLGEMRIALRDGQVVVTVPEATVTNSDGSTALSLGEVDLQFEGQSLARGELRLASLTISELHLPLYRDEDGQLSLQIGAQGDALEAPDIATLLDISKLMMSDQVFAHAFRVDVDDINFSYQDVQTGLTLNAQGRARSIRDGDELRVAANLTLPNKGPDAHIELGWRTQRDMASADASLRFQGIQASELASQIPALAWLAALDAPVSGALRSELLRPNEVGPLSATLSLDAGALRPTQASQSVPFDNASMYLTYDPQVRLITFDHISVAGTWGHGSAMGQAVGGDDGKFDVITAQLMFNESSIEVPSTFGAPIALQDGLLDFRVRLDPFTVEIAQAYAAYGDVPLHADGHVNATESGWEVAINAHTEAAELSELFSLWPLRIAPRARNWASNHVEIADLRDVTAALRLSPGEPLERYVTAHFSHLRMRPFAAFPTLEEVSGSATFHADEFVAHIEQGQSRAPSGDWVDLAQSVVRISDIGQHPAQIALDIAASGGIEDMLLLGNQPPFAVLSRRGLASDIVSGQSDAKLHAAWALGQPVSLPDIDWHLNANLQNVVSAREVANYPLQADALTLMADPERFEIQGAARLGTLRFDGVWESAIGGAETERLGRATGQAWLSAEVFSDFGIALPQGVIGTGETLGDVELVVFENAPPQLYVQSDLRGLTMELPALGMSKPRNESGVLTARAILGDAPIIEELRLEAGALSLAGDVRTNSSGLELARFTNLRAGNWLSGDVVIRGQGANMPPLIALSDATIDWTRFPRRNGAASQTGQTVLLQISNSALQLTPDYVLQGVNAELALSRTISGEFDGHFRGTPISGQAFAQSGETHWRIATQNAGRMLSELGVIEAGRGGRAEITLTPISKAMYRGDFRLQGLQVRQWPLLGGALNTLSLVGLRDQMNGNGLVFSDGHGRLRITQGGVWLDRLALVGPALGISAEGAMNFVNQRVQFSGVMSPAYAINSVGRAISPRDGEGAFGFRFQILGTKSTPHLRVNPVSFLLPGGLRELLR